MKRLIILALALCLLLSGCTTTDVLPVGDVEAVALPDPVDIGPAEALGEVTDAYDTQVRLYYPTLDGRDLAPVTRTISVSQQGYVPRLALELLLSQTPTGLAPAAPAGTSLASLQVSDGLAEVSVTLSGVADEQAIFTLQAAIAATLTAMEGIDAVNLLIGDRKPAIRGMTAGLLRSNAVSLSTQWSELLGEEDALSSGTVTREAAVYYAGKEGQYLVAQAAEVALSAANPLGDLMTLMVQPPQLTCARAALPQADLLLEQPRILTTASGERVARVTFAPNLMASLEGKGVSAWQLYGALTLTLTGFVSELDGVCVYIGDAQVLKASRGSEEVAFEGGVLRRSDFEADIGQTMTLYFTAQDGTLQATQRLYPADDAPLTAQTLLTATLSGPAVWEENLSPVAPEGVSAGDILGVRVENGQAVINFRDSFYEKCADLTAAQERNLAYSLVNALTSLPQVNQVWWQREGRLTDYLSAGIYLRTPLLRNPGLISQPVQVENLAVE